MTLALMPQMVWDTQFVAAASLLVIFAYCWTNLLFTFLASATIRLMVGLGEGVLVPVATNDYSKSLDKGVANGAAAASSRRRSNGGRSNGGSSSSSSRGKRQSRARSKSPRRRRSIRNAKK